MASDPNPATRSPSTGTLGLIVASIAIGAIAGVLTALSDFTIIVVKDRVVDSARSLPYAACILILFGAGAGAAVAALWVLGRGLAKATGKRGVTALPLALALSVLFIQLNWTLFDGPAISQKSWVGTAKLVFYPGVCLAILVGCYAIAGIFRRGRVLKGLAGVLLAAMTPVLCWANLTQLGAYTDIKVQLSLATWGSMALLMGLVWSHRRVGTLKSLMCGAVLIAAAIGGGCWERRQDSIMRVRGLILRTPLAATQRALTPIESLSFDRLVPLPDFMPADSLPGVTINAGDNVAVQKELNRRVPKRQAMNVLWIAIDALRADHVGCYGYERPTTPNIDRFAEESILFERATTPTPASAMAYSSTLNGLYGRACPSYGVENKIDLKIPEDFSLASQMKASGRTTFGITSFFYKTQQLPVFATFSEGFETFNPGERRLELTAEEVTDQGLKLIRESSDLRRSFFGWLHYMEPHGPYKRHAKFPYGDRPVDIYDGEINHVDVEVGRLFAELDKMGLTDNTIIVLYADHGESFGEHNQWRHGGSLYQHQTHVPLLIRVPGDIESRRVKQWVGLSDLAPTCLSLIGVKDKYNRLGRDLTPLILGQDDDWTDFAYSERPWSPDYSPPSKSRSICSGDLKLIWEPHEKVVMGFDLVADPAESKDIYDPGDPGFKKLVGLMSTLDKRINSFSGLKIEATGGPGQTLESTLAGLVDRLHDSKSASDVEKECVDEIVAFLDQRAIRWLPLKRDLFEPATLERMKRTILDRLNPSDLESGPREPRNSMLRVLIFCGGRDLFDIFRKAIVKPKACFWRTRIEMLIFCAQNGDETIRPYIARAFETTSVLSMIGAADGLAHLGDDRGRGVLRAALDLLSAPHIGVAARGLQVLGDETALYRIMFSGERQFRRVEVLELQVAEAVKRKTSFTTAALIHLANTCPPKDAAKAKAELDRRLGEDSERAQKMFAVLFGAQESARYGKYAETLKTLEALTAEDDRFVGPRWWILARSAWEMGDVKKCLWALDRLEASCPDSPLMMELARRSREHVNHPPRPSVRAVKFDIKMIGKPLIQGQRTNAHFLTRVEITNRGERYVSGGDWRGNLQLGWGFRNEQGEIEVPRVSRILPVTGILPGESRKMWVYGQMPKKKGRYTPILGLMDLRQSPLAQTYFELEPVVLP